MKLLVLVKHDCPVCDQVLPVLDSARASGGAIQIVSQSSAEETAAQAQRLGLATVPELDPDLSVSARFDPDAVPAVLLLDDDREQARIEGLDRGRLREVALGAGVELELDGLPERRPGCASITRDPVVAARPSRLSTVGCIARSNAVWRVRGKAVTCRRVNRSLESACVVVVSGNARGVPSRCNLVSEAADEWYVRAR